MKNQMKNELPFARPTMPVAKANAIATARYAPPTMA